jgi:hypothetical protein
MAVTLQINDVGPPKRDLIEMAFEECGSAGYEFERTPEEVSAALRKLNAMMGEWPWNQLGYPIPTYGIGLPEELSGIAPENVQAVALHLAMRIAPNMGASLSAETKAAMTRSFNLLASRYATPPTALIALNTPRGTGHRGRSTFIRELP